MESSQMTTKKALAVVGFLVLLIGLSLVVPADWFGTTASHKRTSLVLKNPNELAILEGDSNRNSNPDWRDLLLETVSTTTQAKAEKVVVDEKTKARLSDPNNLTASFSKNIYTASAYAQKNGQLSGDDQKELVSTLLKQEAKKVATRIYTVDDVTVAPVDTVSTKREYGNALGKLLKKADSYRLGSNDIIIVQAYNQDKDSSVLESLTIKKNNLDAIINDLLKVQVPYSALPYHLLMVNKISEYRTVVEGLSMTESDPVRAAIAFNNYYTVNTQLNSALTSVQMYFVTENITFTQTDPGYLLMPEYTENKI